MRSAPLARRNEPGRLCLITETFHPVRGGGETQARALAAGLVAHRWSVLVLTRRSDASLPSEEVVDGADVRRIPPTGRSRVSKWALLLTALWALWRHRRAYDVILVCGFRILGVPAVAVARLLGKRCVLKADSVGEMSGEYFEAGLARHGLSVRAFPLSVLLRARNRLLSRADAFVAISTPLEEELLAAGVESPRIVVIPNSVDVERFRPVEPVEKRSLRTRLGLPEDALIVVYTGRLVSYKGLPMLLAVWRDLVDEASQGAPLLALVGSGGLDIHDCEEDLVRYVEAHALGGQVRFVGEVASVVEYLQAADALVLPSENEAFGLSAVEAMAVGLPVVVSDAGGLVDVVRDGVDGLRFRAGEREELQLALARLVADARLRGRLGEEARRAASTRFAETAVVERYAELLAATSDESSAATTEAKRA
jgi:glycosyltransferase involved in cell wall biosynthesis